MNTKSSPVLVSIEEPYDDYERELLRILREIRERADRESQPYVEALARSRMLKPTRGYMILDPLAQPSAQPFRAAVNPFSPLD